MSANNKPKAPTNRVTNNYGPAYQPPPEPPAPMPAPKVENKIEVPATMNVTTMTDLVDRIQENASILFPASPRLKVSTALAPSGLLCHAIVVGPKNEESKTSRYKVLLKGPGVSGVKNDPGRGRREALVGLLEELEKRVGKEMFGT
ncbi:hypothetical protein MPH_06116 [Macrophomina phaseolina MS6]|uniref:Uncharacterized protein n=1 Tax=Macrophomina phaseolina (strain MS6) TaxID=1126212 RepID=K2RVD4_MACPH|nr:hypothetical protein MPH_06116 [Macrophomina phaseolina MS6]